MFIELEIIIVDSLDASSGFMPFILSRANEARLFERDSSLRVQVPRTIQQFNNSSRIGFSSIRGQVETRPIHSTKQNLGENRENPCVQAWRIHGELHVATIRIRPLARSRLRDPRGIP